MLSPDDTTARPILNSADALCAAVKIDLAHISE